MKTLVSLSALITMLTLGFTQANAQAFQKGTKLFDAGFEIQESFDESVIPVFVNFEAGITEDIGIGAKARYWTKYDVNSLVIQATGNYHFGRLLKLPVDKLDLFAGLGLGVNRIWVSDLGDYSINSFIVSPGIGARYFFTEKFGVTAKLGFDSYRLDDEDLHFGERYTDASFSMGISLKF